VIIKRHAARAIILTPGDEILLLRIKAPEGCGMFWITPGGGLEAGETIESGLRRELYEELGLSDFQIGPLVWRRQHTFNWGEKRICQYEQYHIVHLPRFEPIMSDVFEMQTLDTIRWWRVADLPQVPERLTPLSLAQIVENYLAFGPSGKLPEVEVLED